MEIYCLSYKKILKEKISKNNKPYVIGNCNICDKLKPKFLSIKKLKEMAY